MGAYDERYRVIADVDLYDRLLPKYMAANLPKALLGVRRHSNQASNSKITACEAIDLSLRRLAMTHYSTEDLSNIRAGLSHSYLTRARALVGGREYLAAFQDLGRSISASPRSFTWDAFKMFVIYNIPRRYRAKLKGFLTRIFTAARLLKI